MDIPFSLSSVGEFKVVALNAPYLMNSAELERLGTALNLLADAQANGKILIDFSKVETFASQAIAVLVTLHKKTAQVAGGQLVICGVNSQLMELLKITRLDRLLKIVKRREDVDG